MKPKFTADILTLPRWSFTAGDPRVPHRHYVLASCRVGRNEFFVCRNRTRKLFWIHGVGPGFAGDWSRATNTFTTTSTKTAEAWIAAVQAGRVKIED